MTTTFPPQSITVYEVDPERLEHGTWSHKQNRTLGEGDIAASYSGDTIALHGRVRKPFVFQGTPWVCVGTSGRGGVSQAKAYRLTDAEHFAGVATTYAEKTRSSDTARRDPMGFYHGMLVNHGRRLYVMTGPQAVFKPGNHSEQLDLFDT